MFRNGGWFIRQLGDGRQEETGSRVLPHRTVGCGSDIGDSSLPSLFPHFEPETESV